MNTGGDAAEQIFRMSMEGFEVAAKITGAGARNLIVLLVSVLREEKKIRGKARLTSMMRSGKELKVFTVKNCELEKFTHEAKKYGVLYCVLANRKNTDPNTEVDIIVRAEDAAKINRVAERLNLSTANTASIETDISKVKDKEGADPETAAQEKDKLLDALFSTPTEGENVQNPLEATTEKSPQSEPISDQPAKTAEGASMTKEKPSVKEELRKIKDNRSEQDINASSSTEKSSVSKAAKEQPAKKAGHKKTKKAKHKEAR